MERPQYIELQKDFLGHKKGDTFKLNDGYYCSLKRERFHSANNLSAEIVDEVPHLIKEIDPEFEKNFELKTGINADVFKKAVQIFRDYSGLTFQDLPDIIDRIIQDPLLDFAK
jgi:hypothetical protein